MLGSWEEVAGGDGRGEVWHAAFSIVGVVVDDDDFLVVVCFGAFAFAFSTIPLTFFSRSFTFSPTPLVRLFITSGSKRLLTRSSYSRRSASVCGRQFRHLLRQKGQIHSPSGGVSMLTQE